MLPTHTSLERWSSRAKVFALLMGTSAGLHAQVTDEVIVADRIRTAFFEAAPASVARSMRRALTAACNDIRAGATKVKDAAAIESSWLCNGSELHFIRAVLINGVKLKEGYICDAADFSDFFKFVPADYIEHFACVPVAYDYAAKTHQVDLSDAFEEEE